jgi:hypothetical protein
MREISDDIARRSDFAAVGERLEHELVVTVSSPQKIAAGSALKSVIAASAVQPVLVGAAMNAVVSGATGRHI